METKHNEFTDANLRVFLDDFYMKVRADDLIGPIFITRIGKTTADWAPHMNQVVDFWSSVLLKTGRYHGKLVPIHNKMPNLTFDHFRRWVQIFMGTVPEHYDINATCEIMIKAQTIMRTLYNSYEANLERQNRKAAALAS